jgi:DNA polymerase-1
VIWDHSEKTFRNKLYDKYKAHRPPPPEDLIPQFPLVREATLAFGVPAIELPGYEADDLIAAYACKVRELGGETVIVSLRQGPDAAGRRRRLDVRPDEGPAYRPRAGVREVRRPRTRWSTSRPCAATASTTCRARPASASRPPPQLINEYGDLDTLLARAGEIKQPKRRETLIEFADQIRLSRPW